MERNEIERIFKSYLPAVRAYNLAIDKFRRIEADAQALKAMVITGMPRSSGKSDPTAAAASRMLKAAQAVRVAAYRYAKIIMEYEQLVALVTDQQAVEIIRLRWEQNIEFDYIPARIHVSRRTMFRYYVGALKEISGKTKDGTK